MATATRPPARAYEQRIEALETANRVRLGRAQVKRAIAAREVRLVDVLHAPPEVVEGMPVLDLLRAVPLVGPKKAAKLLNICGISPLRTVGALTGRQRYELRKLVGRR